MSSSVQTVMRDPSLWGLGNRPDLTPAQHVDLPTGIGPTGPKMDLSRKNLVIGGGGSFDMVQTRSLQPVLNHKQVLDIGYLSRIRRYRAGPRVADVLLHLLDFQAEEARREDRQTSPFRVRNRGVPVPANSGLYCRLFPGDQSRTIC